MKIYRTSDGYRFYLQGDGSLTDSINIEDSDMIYPSLEDLFEDEEPDLIGNTGCEMNIEIKNINFQPEISDTALAFTSEVWINDQMVGTAFNEGLGCNLFSMNDNEYSGTEIETFIQDMLGANRGVRFEKLNSPEANKSGFRNCECD